MEFIKRRKWWLLGAAGLVVIGLAILQLLPEGPDELRAINDRIYIRMSFGQVRGLLKVEGQWPPSPFFSYSRGGVGSSELYFWFDSEGKLVAKEYRSAARVAAERWIARLRRFLGI